jgi:hypothetical protein
MSGFWLEPCRFGRRAESGNRHGNRRCAAHWPILKLRKYFSRTTELVTESRAFYNPSNTAMDSVVSFTRRPGMQPPRKTVVFSVSECMSFDLHFSNSQEH